MSRPRTESETKLISKIVKECAQRGDVVSERLVAFMVEAVLLDPTHGFDVASPLTEQDVQKLQQLCLAKLMEKCSPSLDTIKMQVYFDENYTSPRALLEEVHRVLESRLTLLSREITDSRVKTGDEMDVLYCKIITYILLRSDMGSTTDTNVQEVAAVLQTVFDKNELGPFVLLPKKDKEEKLHELTMIVTRIRLVNKANTKGKEEFSIQELMPALKEALPATSNSIKKELSLTQELAWKYTAVLEKLTDPDIKPQECDVPIDLLRPALYNVRQHEVFLKLLLTDASQCTRHAEKLHKELSSQLKLLRETSLPETAIPTSEVFPLFKDASKLWSDLQSEAKLLNIFSDIAINLQPFLASQDKIFSEACPDSFLEAAEVKTDEQRLAELLSGMHAIDPAEWKTQEWFMPETTAGFNELPLEYNGFCGYALVNRHGLLLPGNPHIGVLKHKEKFYAFSSREAALKFASSPDDFVAQVAEKAKCCAELIQLLKLPQQFSWVTPPSEASGLNQEQQCVKPVTKCEISTQTDLHPVERNISKSHEWNEWELRRQAIKLVRV
ncbi:cilia- and flagella-associated protein 206-like [Cololabis saira]|uniref:cilia- and flagella-associated protein 206-like n=1 Tax=Cololabis saira TaxID=129043 RepID=UPI002AD565EF|nr:cilia- and flagella-associated protein 206-like [Cololabis saira]